MRIELKKAKEQHEEILIQLMQGLNIYNYQTKPTKSSHINLEELLEKVKIKAKYLLKESLIRQDIHITIAYVDNQAVGYSLSFIEDQVGLLDHLFLINQARNIGVGSQLMKEAEQWIISKGITKMEVKVFSWNKNGIKYYEKHDFEPSYICYKKELKKDR